MQLGRYERATHILAPTTGIAQYHSPTKTYRLPVTTKILPFTGYSVLGIRNLVFMVQYRRAVGSPVHESTNRYLNDTKVVAYKTLNATIPLAYQNGYYRISVF